MLNNGSIDALEAGYEALIAGLADQDFAIANDLFSEDLLVGLRARLLFLIEQDELHKAGIGNGDKKARNAEIRRDKIHWLDTATQNPFERRFLDGAGSMAGYFNRTCYTGIQELEFHFACYNPGAFYKRHLDRFRSDKARKFSMITYLNESWQEEDGGELVMYLPDGPQKILPTMGKTVIFRSDVVEHEVLVAHRQRLSITGWMR